MNTEYKQYIVQLFRHQHESTIWSNITISYALGIDENETPTEVAEQFKLAFNEYYDYVKEQTKDCIKYKNNPELFPSKKDSVMSFFDYGYHEIEQEFEDILYQYNFFFHPVKHLKVDKIISLCSIEDFLSDEPEQNFFFKPENLRDGQVSSEIFYETVFQ